MPERWHLDATPLFFKPATFLAFKRATSQHSRPAQLSALHLSSTQSDRDHKKGFSRAAGTAAYSEAIFMRPSGPSTRAGYSNRAGVLTDYDRPGQLLAAHSWVCKGLPHSPHRLRTQCSARQTRIVRAASMHPDSMNGTSSHCDGTSRVLSIQSHVVHGYVGNRCAVFPLQLLGFEVDFINSVQFSNHTGYPLVKGKVFDGDHLSELMAGLEANGLTSYTHLLTGYIGSVSLLERIVETLGKLRQWNPKVDYVCDPVLGDEGRLYVSPEMVESYKAHIVPLASIIVPNQYEAELLTDLQIKSIEEGFSACEFLHQRGPHTVVITSMSVEGDPDHVTLLGSTKLAQQGGLKSQRVTMRIPKIKAYFTGTGDLLAALLLARLHRQPDDFGAAIEQAIASLQSVLTDTAEKCGPAALASERTSEVSRARELRLVQNQAAIVSPTVKLRCTSHE